MCVFYQRVLQTVGTPSKIPHRRGLQGKKQRIEEKKVILFYASGKEKHLLEKKSVSTWTDHIINIHQDVAHGAQDKRICVKDNLGF